MFVAMRCATSGFPIAREEISMPFRPHRPLIELLVRARQALEMTQKEFGLALDASHRTASRWEADRSTPDAAQRSKLAAMVYPKDAQIADELAASAGETLESLGIVKPPPPPPPAPPPQLPTPLLVDSVVCAAADVMQSAPATLRAALHSAFRRARELRLSVEDVERALAPAVDPAARIGKRAKGAR
jgi:transcriptional regulator with XRE-family HTH domain